MEDSVPDHSTLSRFRTALTNSNGMDKILGAFNKQLEKHNVIIQTGIKVDASLTDSLRKPKGNIRYSIAEDRKEDEVNEEEQKKQSVFLKKQQGKGVDTEGRWVKKGGSFHFGFKHHDAVDENGLVVAVHTIAANQHDSKGLIALLKKTPKRYKDKGVSADKGYKVPDNDRFLTKDKIKNHVMHKAYRSRPLTPKTRWVVERTFGSIKKWLVVEQLAIRD